MASASLLFQTALPEDYLRYYPGFFKAMPEGEANILAHLLNRLCPLDEEGDHYCPWSHKNDSITVALREGGLSPESITAHKRDNVLSWLTLESLDQIEQYGKGFRLLRVWSENLPAIVESIQQYETDACWVAFLSKRALRRDYGEPLYRGFQAVDGAITQKLHKEIGFLPEEVFGISRVHSLDDRHYVLIGPAKTENEQTV